VFCDVPCSEDGTLRKALDMWRKWNPGMANGSVVLVDVSRELPEPVFRPVSENGSQKLQCPNQKEP